MSACFRDSESSCCRDSRLTCFRDSRSVYFRDSGLICFRESELCFGRYDKGDVFRIEKSVQYGKLSKCGIKTCEFILKRGNKLYFVEAKSSCPRSCGGKTQEEKQKKYEAFLEEVSMKMRHSMWLYWSILLKRTDQSGVPSALLQNDLSTIKLVLMLVINTTTKTWKPDPELQSALQMRLNKEIKMWKEASVLVLPAQLAKKRNFII